METKFKVGDKVNIKINNIPYQVEIFGCFQGGKGIVYSVRTSEGFILLQNETDILGKVDE